MNDMMTLGRKRLPRDLRNGSAVTGRGTTVISFAEDGWPLRSMIDSELTPAGGGVPHKAWNVWFPSHAHAAPDPTTVRKQGVRLH